MTGTKRKFDVSTQPYRQLSGLNQSMLKVYDEDPGLFYRQFILGEPKEEKETAAFIIGSLADFILLDCKCSFEQFEQKMHEKFALYDGVKSAAQVFELADELFALTVRDTGEDGEVNSEFGDRFKEAFTILVERGKYKKKTLEYALADFNDNAGIYFEAKIHNIGKTVVDQRQIEKAKNIVSQAIGDEFLGPIINERTSEELGVEVINKHVIEFALKAIYQEWQCKMEQDRTVIDHTNKVIYRYDFKTAYDNEEFDYAYLKRQYYLQNGFYYIGTVEWAENRGLGDYVVMPTSFIVLDTSINNRRPLLYTTTPKHVEDALNGFTYGKRSYRGVNELIELIDWSNHNAIWNISKTNYGNRAIVPLKNYEDE